MKTAANDVYSIPEYLKFLNFNKYGLLITDNKFNLSFDLNDYDNIIDQKDEYNLDVNIYYFNNFSYFSTYFNPVFSTKEYDININGSINIKYDKYSIFLNRFCNIGYSIGGSFILNKSFVIYSLNSINFIENTTKDYNIIGFSLQQYITNNIYYNLVYSNNLVNIKNSNYFLFNLSYLIFNFNTNLDLLITYDQKNDQKNDDFTISPTISTSLYKNILISANYAIKNDNNKDHLNLSIML